MRRILWLRILFCLLGSLNLGACTYVQSGSPTDVPVREPMQGPITVRTRIADGQECIINADRRMVWATTTPGANPKDPDAVFHERWVEINVSNHGYYEGLPRCSAHEKAGSRRGNPDAFHSYPRGNESYEGYYPPRGGGLYW